MHIPEGNGIRRLGCTITVRGIMTRWREGSGGSQGGSQGCQTYTIDIKLLSSMFSLVNHGNGEHRDGQSTVKWLRFLRRVYKQ